MKTAYRVIALAIFLITANTSFAACTYATVQGKWSVTYADFDSNIGYSTYGIARATFEPATKTVSLLGGRESAFGVLSSGTLSGTYTINSACQGVITLTAGTGSPTIRFDFVVSGRSDDININFIITEPTNALSGQGFMQKIEL